MAFGCMVESIAREEKGVKVLREFRSREDLFEARGVKGVPPDSTDDSLTESLQALPAAASVRSWSRSGDASSCGRTSSSAAEEGDLVFRR